MKEHFQIHIAEYIIIALLAAVLIVVMYLIFSFEYSQEVNCKDAVRHKPAPDKCIRV